MSLEHRLFGYELRNMVELHNVTLTLHELRKMVEQLDILLSVKDLRRRLAVSITLFGNCLASQLSPK